MDSFLPRIVCLILVLISAVGSVHFYVQPPSFYEHDETVKIICNLKDENAQKVVEVQRMTIERLKSDGHWAKLAIVKYDESVEGNTPNMTVDGYVGSTAESYIMATWHTAHPSFFGIYRCEFFYEDNNADFQSGSSRRQDISGLKRTTHNLFDLVRGNNKDIMNQISALSNRTSALQKKGDEEFEGISKSTTMLLARLTSLYDFVQDTLLVKVSELATRLNRVENSLKMDTPTGGNSV